MSIKTNALIVSVSINQPTKERTDRVVSDDVAVAHNAASDAGRFVKSLYPKHLMAPIDRLCSRSRSFVRRDTYLWNRNEFLLPSTRFMEFAQDAGKIELEFEQAVTAFLNNWSNVMLEAQRELGSLFDADIYPSVEKLKDQFSLKFLYRQVTDENDFRVQMQEDELEELRKLTADSMRDQYADLAKAPLMALQENINKLLAKLREPDREVKDDNGVVVETKPAIFRDSTVNNVLDECQKIIDFGDSVLPAEYITFARELRSALPTPAQLRSGLSIKTQTCSQIVSWSDQITAMLSGDEPEPTNDNVVLLPETPEDYNKDEFAPLEPDPSRSLIAEIDDMFADEFA